MAKLLVGVAIAALWSLASMISAPVQAADLRVMSSTALKPVLEQLQTRFEQKSGHKIVLVISSSNDLNKRVANGETADLLISSRAGVDGLIQSGRLVGPRTDIARSDIGVGVRAGAPRPDISTPDALKKTLLAARAVAYTDPASGGASGIHFVKVLEQLGISAEVNKTAKLGHTVLAGAIVAKGDADIAVQQISELRSVAGIEIVGPLPASLQSTTLISAAAFANARQPEGARALVNFLGTNEAIMAIEDSGLDAPEGRRSH